MYIFIQNKNMTNQQNEWLNKEKNLLDDIRESKLSNRGK